MKQAMMILSLTAALVGAPLTWAEEASQPQVTVAVNGTNIAFPDAQPFLDPANSRMMVPVRFVSEALGASVAWDQATRTVKMNRKGKAISLRVGEKKAFVAGKTVAFDAPAVIRDSRTFVPLRFVSEAFGERVDWVAAERRVEITSVPANITPIPQGEYIVGLVKALKLHANPSQDQAYALAKQAGILDIPGYQYNPSQPLKRIEAARFALRAIREWYVNESGWTDEQVAPQLRILANYPDKTFHGEDFVQKTDALHAIQEVKERKAANDEGKPLLEAFHKSLKVHNGKLTGKVPTPPRQDVTINCGIKFKEGTGKIYEDGASFSVDVSQVRFMYISVTDLETGKDMGMRGYKELPKLTYYPIKVTK